MTETERGLTEPGNFPTLKVRFDEGPNGKRRIYGPPNERENVMVQYDAATMARSVKVLVGSHGTACLVQNVQSRILLQLP